MPVVTTVEALNRLTEAVEHEFGWDEVLEIYNEMFPTHPATEQQARTDASPFIREIVAHIKKGLSAEEIVDLWELVIPNDRNVRYDEEEDRIHYNEESAWAE